MSQGAEPNSRDEEMEHPPHLSFTSEQLQTNWNLVRLHMNSPCFEYPMERPITETSSQTMRFTSNSSPLLIQAAHESRNPHVSVLEARIRKWMPIGEAAVSAYEQQVQKMERDLLLAKMKLGWAKLIVTGTESALHPISRIPLEIWIHIFTWAYGHENEWPVVSLIDLSQVCRHWRQMLTNSAAASLWNPLHLGAGDSLDKKSKKLQYITASGIVDVIMPTERSQLNEKLLVTIFRQPLQDAPIPRIRNLALHDFYSPSGYLARSFFHQTAPLPDIANLYVVGPPWNTGRYPSTEGLPHWATHLEESNLQPEIHIESEMQSLTLIQTFEPDRRLHISWSSLTVYAELNTARADGMLPASHLQRLSSLTKLSLGGVFLPIGADRVELLSLSCFEYIVPWKWISGSTTFQGIDCPNLTELHLSGSSDRTLHVTEASHRFHQDLEEFLPRCPLLQTLEISLPVPYSLSVLLSHLRSCPSLLRLDLGTCHTECVNELFFRELCDLSLIPNLRFLRLSEGGYSRTQASAMDEIGSEVTVMQMIRTRFENKLQFLSFTPKAQERRWRAERTIQEWEPEFSSKWDDPLGHATGFEWSLPHAARLAIEHFMATQAIRTIELMPV
ncbi:hypothetical protein R3P38DRAFT_3187735 [Favolaschia claudopus]|uniref:F-box domain-containing protein n=1 Tax=Favolaschia claudopus TaxID=2862362 RepID=A0AAW0BZ20_9AGAR